MARARHAIAGVRQTRRAARQPHQPERVQRQGARPAPVHPDHGQTAAILALQATAGNRAVGSVLQRAPATSSHGSAAMRDMRADAALLAMHVSMLFGPGGRSYGPGDAVGLPPQSAAFIKDLYQTIFDHRFGAPDELIPAREQEQNMIEARTLMPVIGMQLSLDPANKHLVGQINAALAGKASNVTHNAMMVRALADAELEAKLRSREVAETRQAVLEALQKGWKSYSKFSEIVEHTAAVASRKEGVGVALKAAHTGLDTAFKVAKSLDPESYRKAVDEAREWCREHGAGAAMGTVRAVQVEAEMVELTVGTVNTVALNLSKAAIWALGPSGKTLEELEELSKAGELVGTGGKVALKLGKLVEKLEKFEIALNAIAIAGGLAKLVTADTNFERVDAGIDIVGGGLTVAGKLTKKVGLGAAASSVLMTWEMVKFFGQMGLDAIEGSMWGGLYQELGEIQEKGDRVGVALVSLARAIDERDQRFGSMDASAPERAGADEAVDDLAYRLQKELQPADRRWRESRIHALASAYHGPTRQIVMLALARDYPATGVAEAGIEFMRALNEAYHSAPEIVVDMLVDQGYMDPEKAEKEKKRLAKQAAGGAAAE